MDSYRNLRYTDHSTDCDKNTAPSLTDIFKFSLETQVFLDDLKVVEVGPVYKAGDKDDFNNYRSISVLPSVVRVFAKYYMDKSMTNLQKSAVLIQNIALYSLGPG